MPRLPLFKPSSFRTTADCKSNYRGTRVGADYEADYEAACDRKPYRSAPGPTQSSRYRSLGPARVWARVWLIAMTPISGGDSFGGGVAVVGLLLGSAIVHHRCDAKNPKPADALL
ncbi:hypothetical protein BDW71DRAFT_192923 [Aspergillus fruticulosus]